MTIANHPNGLSSFGNVLHGGMGWGLGNVYYVCQAANTAPYNAMRDKYSKSVYHNDGSSMLHTTIQSALNATVANREDYVLVCTDGSDYDVTAALTMTKKGVHLLCPGGLGRGGIGANAVRLHQTTALTDSITSTGDCIEIGGFFFKGATDHCIVNLSGTRWHNYVHDNFFGGSVTAGVGTVNVIGGTGAVWHSSIVDNYIMAAYLPLGAQTIRSCVGFQSNSSGRNLIARNYIVTGAMCTVTAGVQTSGTNDMVCDNYFHETVATGLAAGTFTEAWDGSTSTVYIGNRVAMDTPAESGGTADNTNVDNLSATDGGLNSTAVIEAS